MLRFLRAASLVAALVLAVAPSGVAAPRIDGCVPADGQSHVHPFTDHGGFEQNYDGEIRLTNTGNGLQWELAFSSPASFTVSGFSPPRHALPAVISLEDGEQFTPQGDAVHVEAMQFYVFLCKDQGSG